MTKVVHFFPIDRWHGNDNDNDKKDSTIYVCEDGYHMGCDVCQMMADG